MAYDEDLAQRVRRSFASRVVAFDEKRMMGGLCFLVDGKMCVGIVKNDLMVRFDPARQDEMLAKPGARVMDFTQRVSKGFVLVEPRGIKDDTAFAFWIQTALAYNKIAKSSKSAGAKAKKK